jgi:PhnB protein|uniref:VOC domain-containing protein n=1 Tax=Picea sitchensis TaxID=3332 RepID=A9NQ48_PICSI|nr:unknown [Picea sitchensis]ABR16723.1 unknown [Picea sitchensis]ACN40534.1 unknown [Picea sitchensis]ACN41042.1 unknown [Picea sitchensis]
MSQENVPAVAENGKGNGAAAKLPTFSTLKPHLIVEAPHAADAISFYKRVFGAEEIAKSHHPKRKADQELPLILHAHLKFGSAEVMVCDEAEEAGADVKSPVALKGTSVILHLETDDVEVAFKRAVDAGATVTEEISERSWGQRYGKVKDPYGFVWSLATPIKEPAVPEDHAQA